MVLALSNFGIAFAAFCVWLTVRIVNRKERWAKRTAAAMVGLTMLYALSFGPACWMSSFTLDRADCLGAQAVNIIYHPVLCLGWRGSPFVQGPIVWYANLWSSGRWIIGYAGSDGVSWMPLPL